MFVIPRTTSTRPYEYIGEPFDPNSPLLVPEARVHDLYFKGLEQPIDDYKTRTMMFQRTTKEDGKHELKIQMQGTKVAVKDLASFVLMAGGAFGAESGTIDVMGKEGQMLMTLNDVGESFMIADDTELHARVADVYKHLLTDIREVCPRKFQISIKRDDTQVQGIFNDASKPMQAPDLVMDPSDLIGQRSRAINRLDVIDDE